MYGELRATGTGDAVYWHGALPALLSHAYFGLLSCEAEAGRALCQG
jgi:hypothetical protein